MNVRVSGAEKHLTRKSTRTEEASAFGQKAKPNFGGWQAARRRRLS